MAPGWVCSLAYAAVRPGLSTQGSFCPARPRFRNMNSLGCLQSLGSFVCLGCSSFYPWTSQTTTSPLILAQTTASSRKSSLMTPTHNPGHPVNYFPSLSTVVTIYLLLAPTRLPTPPSALRFPHPSFPVGRWEAPARESAKFSFLSWHFLCGDRELASSKGN